MTLFQHNAKTLKRNEFRQSDRSGTGMRMSLILILTLKKRVNTIFELSLFNRFSFIGNNS